MSFLFSEQYPELLRLLFHRDLLLCLLLGELFDEYLLSLLHEIFRNLFELPFFFLHENNVIKSPDSPFLYRFENPY